MGSRPKKMINVISEMASTMPAIFARTPILAEGKKRGAILGLKVRRQG
jgi:hypothetical protein